ncbi:serine hydrolase [Bacillus sp. SM2101]|uniref:serine hydrolase n=1 Tax=Bacillus sp. SM2101 TaxID=2805366 RepID=UPI001BDE30CF|nr:serine hydrolase [Bacillus sp. SM2101]
MEGFLVKNRYQKGLIISLLSMIILMTFTNTSQRAYAQEDPLNIEADAAIVVEASTGKILYQKNIDTILGIASMTKMMTEYLLLEAIDQKKVTWDQEYPVSDYVYKISQDTGLSNVPLVQDGKYTVKELYEAMAIYSANGATIALAEVIAGSETEFVKMMNAKAKELGLKDYKFVNSTGLNNNSLYDMHPEGTSKSDENLMSARTTATLAYKLFNDFPEIINTASISKKVFREEGDYPIQMANWNWMLPGLLYEYEGVDGIKTGFTDLAGYCFTSTAERDGMRYITVVMNAKSNGKSIPEARFIETEKLLDYAFANFKIQELYPEGYQIKKESTFPVVKGKEKEIEVFTANPIKTVIKNGEAEQFEPVFNISEEVLTEDGALTAPIKKDDVVGTMTVSYEGDNGYGFLTSEGEKTMQTDIITKTAVEKANWFVLMTRGIGGFFSDVWTSVSETVKGWF